MPRESPFQIQLTRSEREILEQASRRYTSPYRDVIRARIILYAAEGLSNVGFHIHSPLVCSKVFPSGRDSVTRRLPCLSRSSSVQSSLAA